jgi:GT2 family glycosyltransferase
MAPVGSVILNYVNFSDTIECADSILAQTLPDQPVVIVDNGSANDSYRTLVERYENQPRVDVLRSDRNLGYARGNNVGINHLRRNRSCDMVFVVNNDVVVQDGLFEKVASLDIGNSAVISPRVLQTDGSDQRPSVQTDNLVRTVLYYYKLLAGVVVRSFLKPNGPDAGAPPIPYERPDRYMKHVVQGCAFFLTPVFFRHYSQLFPKTFLYWEELNLLWYLKKANIDSVVIDTATVVHKEKQATNRLMESGQRAKMRLRFSVDSMLASTPLYFSSYRRIVRKYSQG